MPTRELLSSARRVQFTTLPALSERDPARHHTLSAEDLAAVTRRRRPHDRLGFAVQLAYLRFPGRPLQPDEPDPPALVAKLAGQVGVDPTVFEEYARERDPTRREHLRELPQMFGFRPFDARVYRELAAGLRPTASGTDAGVALVAALLDEVRARRIVAPALSTVERLGWETRRRALLDGSFGQLRCYAPTLLDASAFAGAPASYALLEALALLQRGGGGSASSARSEGNAWPAQVVGDHSPSPFATASSCAARYA